MTSKEKTEHDHALERYDGVMVDADIESLACDAQAEALVAEWRAAGVDIETQIDRLKESYRGRPLRAAE